MNPKLVGTWFLVRNKNGKLMVVKADRVEESNFFKGSFFAVGMKSGWMSLDDDTRKFNEAEFSSITRDDFNSLDLPTVTYENSPVEIEIAQSGNVYFY